MSSSSPWLTILVPAYNESDRIVASLHTIGDYLAAQTFAAELVVVDDGSRDQTSALAREAARELATPVRVLRYANNRGKGYALKVGFAFARGKHILFTDADLSTPIDETARLLAELNSGADIAIGTRKQPQAEIIRHQPWYREYMGRVFTYLVRTLYTDVSDVTCGFKAFRGDVGRELFSRTRVFGWSFDAEVLVLAHRAGYGIAEVPVRWRDYPDSKVRLFRDTLGSLAGLAQIQINSASGRYDRVLDIDSKLEIDPESDRVSVNEDGGSRE